MVLPRTRQLSRFNLGFPTEFVEYCKADVMVLSKALEVYDTLMKELNDGISPLTNITLASYALNVFRNLYMQRKKNISFKLL